MGTRLEKKEKTLTDYEARQVEKIAAWKSEFPNPFGELFRRAAQPLAKAVEFVIPDQIALSAIEAAYKMSELAAFQEDLKVQASVHDITDLRYKPLEVCDGLSRRVGTTAQAIATVEGALTGAGGVWTALLDVPLLFTLCLRTIIKTGHCYGYLLDRRTDEAWILGALAVALSDTRHKRTQLIERLRTIEDLLLEEIQQDIIVEETASLLTQIEAFEDIPVFGAVTGGLLNLSVAHRTDVTARHLFQERWLRDNGKVHTIKPAPDSGKIPAIHGWDGAFARTGYSTVYGLSFGMAFPVYLLGMMIAPIGRPISSRIRDGARAAIDGANGALGGRLRRVQTAPTTRNGRHSFAPA